MVAISYKVSTRSLEEAVARFSGAADVSLRDAFKRAMRSLVRRFMGIIPPANSATARGPGGQITTADKRRGEAAISRDLRQVFTTLNLKNAQLEAFLTRSAGGDASPIERALGLVAANEPAEVIHTRVFRKNKKPGKLLKNDRAEKYLVSEAELNRLERTLRSRVGKMASGANSGHEVLGIRPPAWVGRHGSGRGRSSYQQTFWRYQYDVAATAVHPDLTGELVRRVSYARRYARNALERESEYILRKTAGRTGLTRPGSRPRA